MAAAHFDKVGFYAHTTEKSFEAAWRNTPIIYFYSQARISTRRLMIHLLASIFYILIH